MRCQSKPYVLALGFVLAVITNALAGEPTFTTIDFPGATFTEANGINAHRDIVGRYRDASGIAHGYLLKKGTFVPIDGPDADFTGAIGINERGDIVGVYRTPDGVNHGFLLSDGALSSLDFSRTSTFANRINNRGDIVGTYRDDDGRPHGFLLSNGQFTGIDVPDAVRTAAEGINDEGTIVGWYTSADLTNHGFLLSDGELTDSPQSMCRALSALSRPGSTLAATSSECTGTRTDRHMATSSVEGSEITTKPERGSQSDGNAQPRTVSLTTRSCRASFSTTPGSILSVEVVYA